MFYVSYVTEYPIYEPAEGGYYYVGETVQHCRRFSSWRSANRYYQKLRAEFMAEHDWETDRVIDLTPGGVGKWINPAVIYQSRYIGEGERVQLTRTAPVDKGWEPYC